MNIPEAKDLIDHLALGYSVDTWRKSQEVGNIMNLEVTEDNVELQTELIQRQLTESGLDSQVIDDMIESMQEKGSLYATAKGTLNKMQATQKNQMEMSKNEEAANKKANEEATRKEWDNIKTTIDKGQLNNISIPQSKQGAFWDYLTTPVKAQNGTITTQKDIKRNTLTLDQKLQMEYMIFSDFKNRR